MANEISVLVVDDSAFMRKMVTEILTSVPGITVAGQARDGQDALEKVEALHPDVITLDVEMPVMDGLAALEQIMRLRPTPVVMVSSLTQAGAEMTLHCLERGAVDFVGKPSGPISLNMRVVGDDLIAKVKLAAGARVRKATDSLASTRGSLSPAPSPNSGGRGEMLHSLAPPAVGGNLRPKGVLVIGSSTGGPRALQTLIPALPGDLNIPIVVVQHMPPVFTATLAERLNSLSALCVREAEEGDTLEPNVVLIAPGGSHLVFDAQRRAHLSAEPPIHGVRPAVDVTMGSLAQLYGKRTVAALLTGMGRDGARAMKTVLDSGGITFAEDETTCVVYGMPKSAVEIGGVTHSLPLGLLADAIARAVRAQ